MFLQKRVKVLFWTFAMSSPFSISNRLMGTKHYSEKAQRILVEGIYNQIESIDDGWSCIRSLAIAEVELNKAQRGEIFSKLRNVFFFQHCKVEQLRTFLDLYNRSFGNLPCQDAISGAYLRLLSERQVHLFVKVQLSLDLMTKFLMVYRTQQNLELNEQLFVAPLKYLNSSITLLSIHQKLNLYYLNNIFDYSTDAEIEEIEKWVSENKDVVLKNISLDLAVKLIWSLGTHRYKKNLYDIDNFLVVFRDLSPEQIIISEMLIEYLENNYSRMNTDQKHRTILGLTVLSQDPSLEDCIESFAPLTETEKFRISEFISSKARFGDLSRPHLDVLAVLEAGGYKPELEVTFFDVIRADILLPDLSIVLEVNGQGHYLPATRDLLNSKSLLSLGLLNESGYKAFPLQADEWNKLKGYREKLAFLRSLIRRIKSRIIINKSGSLARLK